MAETTYTVHFVTNYENTDFTREYSLEGVDSVSAGSETIRNKVNSINESLAGGTATVLANMFVADNYDSSQQLGYLTKISNVRIKSIREIPIQQTYTRSLLEENEFNPNEFPPEDMPYIPVIPTIEGGEQR